MDHPCEERSPYVQSFIHAPAASDQLLKQFAFEFTLALSQRFSFQGKLDPEAMSERMPVRYETPAEALALVESMESLSLLSFESGSFHLLLDLCEDGVEMLFKAITPDAGSLLADFRQLAQRILYHIAPVQA